MALPSIFFRSNGLEVRLGLQKLRTQRMPFATVVALTKTAQAVRSDLVEEMRRVFDRPTPWTLNSLFLRGATKSNPVATVWFKDFAPKGTAAGKYLSPQIEGGQRRQKRFEKALSRLVPGLGTTLYAVPGKKCDVDAYGNISRGQITKILSSLRVSNDPTQNARADRKSRGTRRGERYFVGRPAGGNGPLGVWLRRPDAVIYPIIIFVGRAHYRPRFDFYGVARRTVARTFPGEMSKAWSQYR